MSTSIVDVLQQHPEPAIRYKLQSGVLGQPAEQLTSLREEIRQSAMVRTLLSRLTSAGIDTPGDVYAKWQGAHWILATLADIGYPEGDEQLTPLRDQLLDRWLAEEFYTEFECSKRSAAYRKPGVPVMQGRHRRCASQQSNALWAIIRLGLMNERAHALAERLLHWQWPDGGWNCDKNPHAAKASFMESILPLRALALYAQTYNSRAAAAASTRAAEVFLKRRMFLGEQSGTVIKAGFTQLHYPVYWHYDILHGLKVMKEAGRLQDPRCRPAIDLLRSKMLPDGGWAAEAKYYAVSEQIAHGNEFYDWGGAGKRRMNPWVTVDALSVLAHLDA